MLKKTKSEYYFFTDRTPLIMIWASKNPNQFLNIENQNRLVHLLQNKRINKIFFYYSKQRLNQTGLQELERFANTHKAGPVPIEFRDIDSYFNNHIMSHRDHALLRFALQELHHEGGNLAAMSDLIRTMEIVLSEGMYIDFDLQFRSDHWPEKILRMHQPLIVHIDTETQEINNDAITLAKTKEGQIHPDALTLLHLWQDAILQAYRHPIETLNSQELAIRSIYRLKSSALSHIPKLSVLQMRSAIDHPLSLYLFFKLYMIYGHVQSDLSRRLTPDSCKRLLKQLTDPERLEWTDDLSDDEIISVLACYQDHILFLKQCLEERKHRKEQEIDTYDTNDPSMSETINLLNLEREDLSSRLDLYTDHLEQLDRSALLTIPAINKEFERMYSQYPFQPERISLYKDSVLVFSGPIRLALFLKELKEQKQMSHRDFYHQFSFKSIDLDLKLKESAILRGLIFSQQDGSWHEGGRNSQSVREEILHNCAKVIQKLYKKQ